MTCSRCGAIGSGSNLWHPCNFDGEELNLCNKCFIELDLWKHTPQIRNSSEFLSDIESAANNVLGIVNRFRKYLEDSHEE